MKHPWQYRPAHVCVVGRAALHVKQADLHSLLQHSSQTRAPCKAAHRSHMSAERWQMGVQVHAAAETAAVRDRQ